MADGPTAAVPAAPPPGPAARAMPREVLLQIARDPDAEPAALGVAAREAGADEEILAALARHPHTPERALAALAAGGSAGVLHELAARSGLVVEHPAIGEAILKNPNAGEALRDLVQTAMEMVVPQEPPPPELAGVTDLAALLKVVRDPAAEPQALAYAARELGGDEEGLKALARHKKTPDLTLAVVALIGPPVVLRELAMRPERIQKCPLIGKAMLENPEIDDELRANVHAVLSGADPEATKKSVPLYNLVKSMSSGQRLAFALKGNKEARAILIKDSNEVVAMQVIESPRLTIQEVQAIAQMRDVNENILRRIGSKRQYKSDKGITWSLLNNSKTPTGVAMGILNTTGLSEKELDKLVKNKNISATMQRAARAKLDQKRKPHPQAGGH
jgi:hypothetical protein